MAKSKKRVIKAPKPEVAPIAPALTHSQLLAALLFFWDAFERSTLNFFLIRDTAHQVIDNVDLSGDSLTLGLRKMEVNGGQFRIFKDFITHEKVKVTEFEKGYLFDYKGVPVFLYIYDENPCLDSLDIVHYAYETFNTPNPFKAFEEQYDL